MVEKDPIDNLIRNKMQERSFSPGPNDWRDMETLLNRHMPVQHKKRWFRVWIPVLFSIAGAAFIWWPAATPVAQPPVTSSQAIHAENTTSLPAAAPETDATTNAAHTTTEQNVAADEQTPASVGTPSSAQPAQPLPNKSNTKNINATPEKSVAAKASSSAAGTPSVKPILPLYSKTEVTTKNPPAPEKESMRGPSAQPNHQPQPPTAAAASLTTPSLPVVPPASGNEIQKQPDTETAAPINEKNEAPVTKTNKPDSVIPPPVTSNEPPIAKHAADSNTTPRDSTTSEQANAPQDSSTTPGKKPKASANPDKKFSLALSAGVQGWQLPKSKFDTLSRNRFFPAWCLGVQGTYRFNSPWSVSAGIQYSMHTRLPYEKIYNLKDYSFSSTSHYFRISTSRLHYLHVPAEVQYHIGNRHTLLVAWHTDVLFNSNNIIEHISYELDTFPGTFVQNSRSATSGYTSGFRRVSFSLALGYACTLNNRWMVLAKAQYGLTDNTRNTYFGNRDINRNTALQFIVRYNIIQF